MDKKMRKLTRALDDVEALKAKRDAGNMLAAFEGQEGGKGGRVLRGDASVGDGDGRTMWAAFTSARAAKVAIPMPVVRGRC